MSEFGMMGVDWEERINFDRMRRERLQKAKAAMEKADVDALFIFALEDVRYLTGYRNHLGPVTTLGGAVVVLPRGGDPILCTGDYKHVLARMPWMHPDNVLGRPVIRTEGGTTAWAEKIKAKIGKLAEGKIGVDITSFGLSQMLSKSFPKAQFVDAKKVLSPAKMIKTRDEIECQYIVNMITEAGFQALLDNLKPGVRECQLLSIAWQKFTDLGSEWSQCANIVCSGPYTAPYRRFTSDRVIREGDMVIVDIGACFNGYWGDFTRTFICGDVRPTKAQIDLCQESYDTLFKCLSNAVVGKTNGDVGKYLNNPEHNPNSDDVSSGHGAGVNPWEAPWISFLTPDAIIPLQQGMLFSVEPYAGKPGIGGFRLENQVFVGEKEPDIFTTMSFDERLLRDVHPLDKTTGRKIRYPSSLSDLAR
jgi:Xaa-Pro aminopeptidase